LVGQWRGAFLVENRQTNHPDIARLMIFLLRVRFAHRTETKGCDGARILSESFHRETPVTIESEYALSNLFSF